MTAHLTTEQIDIIVRVLDGWDGRLTWELLREAIELRIGEAPKRQALSKHHRILKAFQTRQLALASSSTKIRSGPIEVIKLRERLDLEEARSARLKSENDDLLDQFRRWAYNAHIAGLSIEELNAPLDEVDRRSPK